MAISVKGELDADAETEAEVDVIDNEEFEILDLSEWLEPNDVVEAADVSR